MVWLTWTIYALLALILLVAVAFGVFLAWLLNRYMGVVARIFEEKPLFIIPRGQPLPDSEEVRFPTTDGLTLAGSYLRTPVPVRRGVILFGPEYGSTRWSCGPYCEHLRAAGFDLFTFEFRNQGESDAQPGYEPLQWVTEREVADLRAAIAYLKQRNDADPEGIGFFGVSRGGGAGIIAAASEPWLRCIATDGAFATRTTMMPYMKKWVRIYSDRLRLQNWMPNWMYALIARIAIGHIGRKRGCRFANMERAIARLTPRPLFMIHGGGDTYIKPMSAQQLLEYAREPKELWMVEGAKHNQALHVAGAEYKQRLLDFFTKHLGSAASAEEAAAVAAPAEVAARAS